MSQAKAELIADRGEAAAGPEFFRSPEFFEAEGVTHTLRIAAGDLVLLAPLLVREIPGEDLCDATSPYGYPGLASPPDASAPAAAAASVPAAAASAPAASASIAALDPAAIDFSATGLVSAFLRHRLGAEPPLSGASERNTVQIADPALPRKSRMSDRQQIRKNLRRGYSVEIVAGPETDAAARQGFLEAYEQTMRRTGASDRYFFGAGYFETVLGSPLSHLAIARDPEGEVAAASLAVISDGMLHYYLSGTADSHLRDSPMKNIVSELTDLATELELPLSLGGGLSPGDRLEEFKRGFANREEPWRTSEIVCDAPEYERLSADRDAGGFFPAYRAP